MHIENSMSLIYTSTRNKIQLQKFEKFRSFQIIAIEGKMRKIMASVKWTDAPASVLAAELSATDSFVPASAVVLSALLPHPVRVLIAIAPTSAVAITL